MSVAVLLSLNSCKTDSVKEEEKQILEQQVQALEEEQQALEQIFSKIIMAQDSLQTQQQKLQLEKQKIEASIKDLDSAEDQFTEMKKEDMERQLKEQRENYQARLQQVEDSLGRIGSRINSLQNQLDTLDIAEKQLVTQRMVSQEKLVTGIDAIDARLDELEKENLLKQKEIDINIRKIELAESKIDLLEDEKTIYQREKNELLKENADETEIENYNRKIKEVEGYITEEQDKISVARASLRSLNDWIADFAELKEKLKENMEKEYSEQQTIAEFTRDEMNRLSSSKNNIDSELEKLTQLKNNLEQRKESINNQIDTLDREIGLVKNKDLAELLDKRSLIEKDEAALAREESSVLKDEQEIISQSREFSEIDTSEDSRLFRQLDYEIKNKRMEIERLKSSIAASNENLAEKKALIEQKRSKNAKAVTTSAIVTVFVVVGILILLYLLGRRKLSNKSS
jgi:chromosome segregation ATPase